MQDPRLRQFWVTVYKTDKVFFPAGQPMLVHCHHVWEWNGFMNTQGEVTPTLGAQFPIDMSPPEAGSPPVAVPAALNPQGGTYNNVTQFPSNMVAVTKIKDMYLLEEYIVDTANYYANVVTCNPVQHN